MVLVIDHEPDVAASIAELLEIGLEPARAVAVTSLDEAKDFLRSNRVDLLLVAHKLPGGDGLDFLEEVRRDDPDVLAALMVYRADSKFIQAANQRVLLEGILVKPFKAEELLETVQGYLEKLVSEGAEMHSLFDPASSAVLP